MISVRLCGECTGARKSIPGALHSPIVRREVGVQMSVGDSREGRRAGDEWVKAEWQAAPGTETQEAEWGPHGRFGPAAPELGLTASRGPQDREPPRGAEESPAGVPGSGLPSCGVSWGSSLSGDMSHWPGTPLSEECLVAGVASHNSGERRLLRVPHEWPVWQVSLPRGVPAASQGDCRGLVGLSQGWPVQSW